MPTGWLPFIIPASCGVTVSRQRLPTAWALRQAKVDGQPIREAAAAPRSVGCVRLGAKRGSGRLVTRLSRTVAPPPRAAPTHAAPCPGGQRPNDNVIYPASVSARARRRVDARARAQPALPPPPRHELRDGTHRCARPRAFAVDGRIWARRGYRWPTRRPTWSLSSCCGRGARAIAPTALACHVLRDASAAGGACVPPRVLEGHTEMVTAAFDNVFITGSTTRQGVRDGVRETALRRCRRADVLSTESVHGVAAPCGTLRHLSHTENSEYDTSGGKRRWN